MTRTPAISIAAVALSAGIAAGLSAAPAHAAKPEMEKCYGVAKLAGTTAPQGPARAVQVHRRATGRAMPGNWSPRTAASAHNTARPRLADAHQSLKNRGHRHAKSDCPFMIA